MVRFVSGTRVINLDPFLALGLSILLVIIVFQEVNK